MRFLHDILGTIHFVLGIISLWAWYKIGFKCPRYIHILAGIGGGIGMGVAVITPVTAPINDTWGLGKWWTPIIFSGIVYFFFGFLGGGEVMKKSEKEETIDSEED